MDGTAHFRSFAAYNAWANRRLYDAVGALSQEALVARRPAAYFESVLGTLNHLLVGDRAWMDRFERLPPAGLPLNTILHEGFAELRTAREAEDARIARFVDGLTAEDLAGRLAYKTSAGTPHSDPLGRLLTHFFNHQTHHRGQAHALIKEAGAEPPPLDYIYFMREGG